MTSIFVASPASAETREASFSFRTGQGRMVECQIAYTHERYLGDDGTRRLYLYTGVTGGPGPCYESRFDPQLDRRIHTVAVIDARYDDGDDTETFYGQGEVQLNVELAASGPASSKHQIYFVACNCSSPLYTAASK